MTTSKKAKIQKHLDERFDAPGKRVEDANEAGRFGTVKKRLDDWWGVVVSWDDGTETAIYFFDLEPA